MIFSQAERAYVEQRQSPRYRVDCPAWVDYGDGVTVRACRLWDVSETGARITIDNASELPREFSLVLSYDGSIRRRCRVVWTSDDQAGIRYLAPPSWNWTSAP